MPVSDHIPLPVLPNLPDVEFSVKDAEPEDLVRVGHAISRWFNALPSVDDRPSLIQDILALDAALGLPPFL